jgi:hypothetical protein
MRYRGSCHCGAIRFAFDDEPLTTAITCNCSMCSKRGTVMSARYYDPGEITVEAEPGALTLYLWGDRMVNHYFCARCGVYPFHDVVATPGRYRVNLRCVEGLDLGALAITEIDGRSY